MELKTYDEILVKLCDDFDSLIAPKTLLRSNANVIYLMFKAVAKAEEVINNLCVKVSNKFDPANCSEEDLLSVAELVGTKKLLGSGSGLLITATNTQGVNKTLKQGTYYYTYDADTIFVYEMLHDTVIEANSFIQFVAITETYGSFPVTSQGSIDVTSNEEIPSGITFSCTDNANILGEAEETNLAFRKRILSDTTRQNSLMELQNEIKALPYIFDARIYFNNSLDSVDYEGITVPSYHMAIFYSGEAKNEIAEIVASKSIFPTVETQDSVEVQYSNSVFVNGNYKVYLIPFLSLDFTARVSYTIDTTFITSEEAQSKMRSALYYTVNKQIHKDYVKESDLYTVLSDLSLQGVDILNIDLFVDSMSMSFITVPLNKIANLTDITFEEV